MAPVLQLRLAPEIMVLSIAMWVVFMEGKWHIQMLCGWSLWRVSDIYICYVGGVMVGKWRIHMICGWFYGG